ncbi:OmpW/AlkL family protein [Sandaracinobacteroides hominis]|uniref:OmpW/AlkL family protein n=1 Tax=Sandaracinobacteroides hominis TaxID=2780086 RepID=UPI0018F7A1DC|nr:OmpW family outer membrane protein [Sandaracinobacteroides hominis]
MRFATCRNTATAVAAILLAGSPAFAEGGDWIVRGRGIAVDPSGGGDSIQPTFPTEGVSVTTGYAPELDVTYMVTNNIGLELIAATTKHAATGQTGTTGSIGRLLSTWALPPTLTLQYHFAPDAVVRPYVGVGLNYTIFYNSRPSSQLEAAVGDTRVSLSDSFGYALQGGLDIPFGQNSNWLFNLDFKYIDMDTTARLRPLAIPSQSVRVNIDPLVIGVGIGYRF